MNITGGFKDRLMDTLHGAVKHFNETGDPNQAVVKAARDADFNPEQTTRLVEAFNTARTLFHYKSASDRTSSFALADAGAVLTDLFERQEPAARVGPARPKWPKWPWWPCSGEERTASWQPSMTSTPATGSACSSGSPAPS